MLDEKLEAAIESGDEDAFTAALRRPAGPGAVRRQRGCRPTSCVESDLLLPYSDASLAEVRDLLSGDGLIPGRSQGTAPADA